MLESIQELFKTQGDYLIFVVTALLVMALTDFGIRRFRVLTVTTSAARVKSLVDACSQLKSGHRLFLFADRTILSGDMLSAVWRVGKRDESLRLLD